MKITLPPITQGPWFPCGTGTLLEPGNLKPVSTQVIEAECWGRIGEYYDYSNESAANFQAMLAVPDLLQALADIAADLRHGAGNPQTMASLACEALQKAGSVITE